MNMSQLTQFFLWCTIINAGIFLFTFVFYTIFNKYIHTVFSKMYTLPETYLEKTFFTIMIFYKAAIIFFNFIPYLALKIIC